MQEEILTLHVAAKIDPYVSRRFPLERFREALALLRDGKAEGKIVLEIG